MRKKLDFRTWVISKAKNYFKKNVRPSSLSDTVSHVIGMAVLQKLYCPVRVHCCAILDGISRVQYTSLKTIILYKNSRFNSINQNIPGKLGHLILDENNVCTSTQLQLFLITLEI